LALNFQPIKDNKEMVRIICRCRVILLSIILLAYLILVWTHNSAAQQCKPLLLTGKQTLFQRVISHPGARLYVSADESSPLAQARVTPFTVFYVYERVSMNSTTWLKIGPSTNCEVSGWTKGTLVSDWRQSLTLVFTERAGRKPVLFFNDLEALEQVAGSTSPSERAGHLASKFTEIKSGSISQSDDFPIIAMEPTEEAISRQRFYLMPIFHTVELYEGVKFLEIASIDPGSLELLGDSDLGTSIAFVIDTTISMKPYIERTREAVRRIYDAVEGAGLSDTVAFGLVAFRSSIKKTPRIEYVSKVISDFKDGHQRAALEHALAGIEEAGVSTHTFNEDAFAGLKTAIENLNWKPYQSRLILLITDAGAIRNDDIYSATGMNEAEIADIAAAKGIKIFVLHVKTPLGKRLKNHPYAEAQYKVLTGQSDPTIGDLYVPIDASVAATGVRTFGQVVEGVSAQMVDLVLATSTGKRLHLPDQLSSSTNDIVTEAMHKASILGYSMHLEYLGLRGKVQAPQVVTSWVSDMDLQRPNIPAFTVTVLLTKNQLSDLHQRLKIVLDQAQRTKRTGAKDFFQGILSAAAQISRDPSQFSKKPHQNLGQLGLLGEFLDDLPYRSNIMRLTEEDWYRMSVGEQQALIDDLKSKIKRYQQYHDDVDNWVSFGATGPGDMVYRVPLSMMP
jgi:serine/threonine-protein kinase PpkA